MSYLDLEASTDDGAVPSWLNGLDHILEIPTSLALAPIFFPLTIATELVLVSILV